MDKVLYFATLEGTVEGSFYHRVFCFPWKRDALTQAKEAWASYNEAFARQRHIWPTSTPEKEAIIEIYEIVNRYHPETECYEPLSSSIKYALMFTGPVMYKWNNTEFDFALVSS